MTAGRGDFAGGHGRRRRLQREDGHGPWHDAPLAGVGGSLVGGAGGGHSVI